MSRHITILGFGPVGQSVAERLLANGDEVTVAQRRSPSILPQGARFMTCDALDRASTLAACKGAEQIVLAVGFPYEGKVWADAWPNPMHSAVAAAEATGARLLFFDNMYMYGPRNEPLTEETPLADFGVKPASRAAATRIWRAAADAGRARIAALRAPDFYGPGVAQSALGDRAFGALAQGKTAQVLGSADLPHDFAYVPDIGRALETLLAAPDEAYGQAWHVPSAPTRTMREILTIAATALGVAPKVSALPFWVFPLLGLFVPPLREMSEMRFMWDRPYRVDSSKFARRFWSDATPFEIGAVAAAKSFRKSA